MVKELNNMKNKKSNNYKPYDSSNSLVRRVTSRVSQLLPQPTSWLSRFLSRPPENAEPVDCQDAEDEEIIQPPPSKRMRTVTVQTSTEYPLFHNSIGSLENRRSDERREEELSPIRSYKFPVPSSRSADVNAPGPSGLSRHHLFVASTPSEPLTSHQEQAHPKVNGEDRSDSDSVSHASSLPPESDQEQKSFFRSLNKRQGRHIAPDELSNSLLRSKQLRLDLSSSSLSSSRGRASFDTTVFSSPFKGRLCGGLSTSRDDSVKSPFYRSNTTFGGASSCNDSLLRTRSLHSEVPIVIQPTQPQRVSDNLGSSTKKILKALEQFSTPMLDQSRRVQPRDRGLKRRVEIPYKELVIPQMPDLLRIKRRDARHARQSGSTLNVPTSVPQSSKQAAVHSVEAIASTSSSLELSKRLCNVEDVSKDKMELTCGKKSEPSKIVKESPSVMTGLPLTALPKFDIGLVKTPSHSTDQHDSKPTAGRQFKFSQPINLSHIGKSLSSIPPAKKFSKPLCPEATEAEVNASNKTPIISNCVVSTEPKQVAVTMNYSPPSNIKLKRKESPAVSQSKPPASSTLKSGSVLDILNKSSIQTPTELKAGSITDALKSMQDSKKIVNDNSGKWECEGCYVSNDVSKSKCAACEQPRNSDKTEKKSTIQGFGDKFKMSSNEWECSSCCVRNKIADDKCVACGEVKSGAKSSKDCVDTSKPVVSSIGFGDKFKPPVGSWECGECLVQNKSGDTKCVSCSTDKPGASSQSSLKSLPPPLSSLFKKPEGSWECDTCLVRNKSESTSCEACNTARPGAKSSNTASPSNTIFSFGIPNASDDKTKVASTPAATPLSSLFKKPEGSWECDTCLVRNKSEATSCEACSTDRPGAKSSKSSSSNATFSFGIPNPPDTGTKFSFGTVSDAPTKTTPTLFSSAPTTQTSTFTFGIPSTAETKTTPNSIFSNVKTISSEKKCPEGNMTPKTDTDKLSTNIPVTKSEPTFVFSVPTSKDAVSSQVSKSIFGNVVTTAVTTPSTTFGISSTSSSVTPASLPIFVNQISSTKTLSSPAEKNSSSQPTNPIFTFGSSSGSLSTTGDKPDVVKPLVSSTPLFPTADNEVKPMATSPVRTDSTVNSDKVSSESKNNLFIFNNKITEAKPFQNSSNPSESPLFGSAAGHSFNVPSSSAPMKPIFSFTGGFAANAQKSNAPINSFGAQPTQEASSGFGLKPSEPNFTFTEKKLEAPATPFQFNSSNNHTNNFENSAPATNQFNSGFGNAASSPFSSQGSIFGSSAPQPAQTASFLFGAGQTNDRPPAAPTFNLTPQSGTSGGNSVSNTAVAGGFAFGQTQNSTAVQPPAFDPNMKPVFNFSGGQTPTFSAPSSTVAAVPARKIRRAVRRTTQK